MTLTEFRQSLGLSQSQMGERLGVTGVTCGQWETGRRTPSARTLIRICEEFRVVVNIRPTGEISFTPENEFEPHPPVDPDDPALGLDITT